MREKKGKGVFFLITSCFEAQCYEVSQMNNSFIGYLGLVCIWGIIGFGILCKCFHPGNLKLCGYWGLILG